MSSLPFLALFGFACSSTPPVDSGGTATDPTLDGGTDGGGAAEHTADDLSGSWDGQIAASLEPGEWYRVDAELVHDGEEISGTILVENGRQIELQGTMDEGGTMEVDLSFVDGCQGIGSATGSSSETGLELSGSYSANDCYGPYTGRFELER